MANSTKPLRRSVGEMARMNEWRIGCLKGLGLLLSGLLLAAPASAANCRLSLSQPIIDYGLLRPGEQLENRGASLGKRIVRLNVICVEAAVIALRFQGVPANETGYRFGRQGFFNLTLQHPQLDGKPIELAQWHNPTERDAQLRPGQSLVVLVGGVPARGHAFSAQVQVDTWLSSAATAVGNKTTYEGNGRFELVSGG